VCKLRASSVQAPCKFVHVQRKSVARFRATLLRCTCSRWNSWISYCVHPSCMKTCNAKALHVFMQLGCKNLQVSLSETCTHLVEATYVARDCRRVPPHKKSLHTQHRHTHTQKTTTQYDSSTILHENIPKTHSTTHSNSHGQWRLCGAGGARDERQRQHAAVAVARPVAAAR
jgi:hypothetical protein